MGSIVVLEIFLAFFGTLSFFCCLKLSRSKSEQSFKQQQILRGQFQFLALMDQSSFEIASRRSSLDTKCLLPHQGMTNASKVEFFFHIWFKIIQKVDVWHPFQFVWVRQQLMLPQKSPFVQLAFIAQQIFPNQSLFFFKSVPIRFPSFLTANSRWCRHQIVKELGRRRRCSPNWIIVVLMAAADQHLFSHMFWALRLKKIENAWLIDSGGKMPFAS